MSKWISSYHSKFFNAAPCKAEEQNARPVIAANIVGPLISLAVGSTLSLCILLAEITTAKCDKGIRPKVVKWR